MCVDVLLEHVFLLQAFLTCPEGPGSEPFPPEIYEQVDQTVWIDRISGKVINMHP